MTDFLLGLKNAAPLLITIFIIVFALILIIRLILTLLIHFAIQKYKKLREKNPFKRKNLKKYEKEEDELLREIPKAHSATRAHIISGQNQGQSGSYDLIASEEQQIEQEQMNEVKIVDMVKPIGFWTSMILGQKLTYLIQSAQVINKRGKQGFWVSMIEAQEQAAGRQHGRTR
jgi:hypothetical protein